MASHGMCSVIIFSTLWFALLPSAGSAGNCPAPRGDRDEYRLSKIPLALLINAHAVVRRSTLQLEIESEKSATIRVTFAATIFDSDRRSLGEAFLWYDEFHHIEDLDGALYDAEGEEIRSLSKSDTRDYSAFSSYSLYEDDRVRTATLYHDVFPYTVELTYEISLDGFLSFPTWYAQESEDPVEWSQFQVIAPRDYPLRYWCSRDSVFPATKADGSTMIYTWEARNLPALSKDAIADDYEDVTMVVRVAPSEFMLDDRKGQMTTWKSCGEWFWRLFEGHDDLPDATRRMVHALVSDSEAPRVRVQKLYQYLQSKTRYVSVQLGIGKWQPFDARYVDERGYGDCKALSNYMIALLKEAGVTAYPVLIRGGGYRRPFIEQFPSNQFNHVIVCVPQPADTVWLECTSQTIPFGHLSYHTENRGALLLSPEGGVVVRTPSSHARQNLQDRFARVTLTWAGSAQINAVTRFTGDQSDRIRGRLEDESPEERERWILSQIPVPNLFLHKARFDGLARGSDTLTMDIELTCQRAAALSGQRLFFTPNIMGRSTWVPRDVAVRLSPVRFGYPYLDRDSILFKLPNQMTFEAVPEAVDLSVPFGRYRAECVCLGDTALVYRRTLEITKYEIPAASYGQYRQFFADIVKADRAQVVLVRKSR